MGTLGGYQLLELLSSDEISSTYKARTREHDTLFLIESFIFETAFNVEIAHDIMTGVFAEAALALRFKHPSFPQVHDIFILDRSQACIVYEYDSSYMPLSELQSRWSTTGMPVPHVKRLMYQLIKAVQHLHSQKLVHQNLGPQVITLQADGLLKLRGLASASVQSKSRWGSMRLPPSMRYAAPEILIGDVSGCPADIWAIGCICGELVTGQPIFGGKGEPGQIRTIASNVGLSQRQLSLIYDRQDAQKILQGITSNGFDSHFRLRFKDMDKQLIDFFKICFEPDPNKRANVDDLLKLPFIREAAKECRLQLSDSEELIRERSSDRSRATRLSNAFMKLTEDLDACGCDIAAAAVSIGMSTPNMDPTKRPTTSSSITQIRRYRGSGQNGAMDYRGSQQMSFALNPMAQRGFIHTPDVAGASVPWLGAYGISTANNNPEAPLSKTGAELLAGPRSSVPWAKQQPRQQVPAQSQPSRSSWSASSKPLMPPTSDPNDRGSFVRRFVPEDKLGGRVPSFLFPGQGIQGGAEVLQVEKPKARWSGEGFPLTNEFGDELDEGELQMQEESKVKSKAFVSGWLHQNDPSKITRVMSTREAGGGGI